MTLVLRTVLIIVAIQLVISGSAIAVAFHESRSNRIECGRPALLATIVGYSLWRTRDCGLGKSDVYMITPPAVIESLPSTDRERAI
jgi:hypothetical protein